MRCATNAGIRFKGRYGLADEESFQRATEEHELQTLKNDRIGAFAAEEVHRWSLEAEGGYQV